MPLNQRKALNIVFNRATNDFDIHHTPDKITRELESLDLEALAATIPDKTPDSAEFLRCAHPAEVSVKALCSVNSGRWVQYARNLASTLWRHDIQMPIVCRQDGTVINGIGRLELFAEKGVEFAPVVFVTGAEAEFARTMMNLLSMDFDIHTRYADLLRYNSFRRARRVREGLGNGFVFAVHGSKMCYDFDIHHLPQKAAWIKEHGTCVLDFGAGHLTETFLLRQAGIDCTPFEPYRLGVGAGDINKAESISLTREFLSEVAAGKDWTSIFVSSVLNSVPFLADREHIVTLCAALCRLFTKFYACASSVGETGWRQVQGKAFMNQSNAGNICFRLDYEPGIRLGDFQDKPKVQKYHTQKEFHSLFIPFFRSVKVAEMSNNITAVCASARAVDVARLAAAIEFEFDLPYPDGTRMGLVAEAKAAFGKRLGVAL